MFGLKAKIKQAQVTLDDLNNIIEVKQSEIESFNILSAQANTNLQFLEAKVANITNIYNGLIEASEIGVEYTPFSNNCSDIEKEINSVQMDITWLLGQDKAVIVTREYRIDNSEVKGRKFQKAYVDNLLIGFNAYCDNKEKSVTTGNFDHTVNLIDSAFDRYNKKASLLGVSINEEYKNCRLSLLGLKLDLKLAKAEEREKIRENKRRLREQELLLAEAEKERKRLEDEKKAMNIAFAKALTDVERAEIQAELDKIDKRIADVDYRINNSKAGWLYVISSPALKDMVKIGVSRRLNPSIRIRELSSSSLPYPFHTHGFVFSDDCFELESNMHKYFDAQRVSPDKEFFYIKPEEAIEVLKDKFGCKVLTYNLEEFDGESEEE